ncbi:hypothetical protein GCM10009117_22260 [Gangjinia marincola]|uniref:Glycosyltransferase RgtA/B/C/D-like domain-containing protein n=1 Tax=Gangjinia marincola TaxID=578463 RepID=A0ABN1MJE5_9FLAO
MIARLLHAYGYVIVGMVYIALLLSYFYTQDRIEYANGQGMDGVKYFTTTLQMMESQPIVNKAPYVYRLVPPYLAAQLPFGILDNFLIINWIATLMSCLLLFGYAKVMLKNAVPAFLITLYFMLHWSGYLRLYTYYPANCDTVAMVFIMLSLIMLRLLHQGFTWWKYLLFCIILFVGVFTREFIAFFAFGVLLMNQPIQYNDGIFKVRKIRLIRQVGLTAVSFGIGLIGVYITHQLVTALPDQASKYGFLRTIYITMHSKSIFMLITAYFYVFGVLWIPLIYFYKTTLDFFKSQKYLIPLSLLSIVIAWFGGGDTERFIIWFLPITFLVIARVWMTHWKTLKSAWILIPTLISLLFTTRVFLDIPQALVKDTDMTALPFFTVVQNQDFVDLLSYAGQKEIITATLVQYLALSAYMVFMLQRKRKEKLIIFEQ